MTQYLTTTGRLVYDPHRGDMKSRTKWWAVIEIDPEITRLFRHWMNQNWWQVERGQIKRPFVAPAWDAHVSVVRGESRKGYEGFGDATRGNGSPWSMA